MEMEEEMEFEKDFERYLGILGDSRDYCIFGGRPEHIRNRTATKDAEAKEQRCVKKDRLQKAFELSDEDLDLHLIPIDKDEFCSYSAISEAMKHLDMEEEE